MMSGRTAREKGKRGEREVATLFRTLYQDDPAAQIRRGWQAQAGCSDSDVITRDFWVEVKRQKSCNPKAALRQAVADSANSKDEKIPVAVTRDDRDEWIVCLRFADWEPMARMFIHNKGFKGSLWAKGEKGEDLL